MNNDQQQLWNQFMRTGRVEDYLLYRQAEGVSQTDTAGTAMPPGEGAAYGAVDHRRVDPAREQ